MKYLFSYIDMLELHQKIYQIDTDTNEKKCIAICNVDDMPEILTTFCNQNNIDNIKLTGNSNYATKIVDETKALASSKYSLNNLTIEVQ